MTEEGKRHTKIFAKEGEFISSYGNILRGQPFELEISSLEPSVLLRFEHKDLVHFYDRHPCWVHMGRAIAEKILLEKLDREILFLTLSPAERYEKFCQTKIELIERLPQYEIASYLGVTAVALSNIRARRCIR